MEMLTNQTIGIGLMMATALENNGATVYIIGTMVSSRPYCIDVLTVAIGRRVDVLEKAARENNVCAIGFSPTKDFTLKDCYIAPRQAAPCAMRHNISRLCTGTRIEDPRERRVRCNFLMRVCLWKTSISSIQSDQHMFFGFTHAYPIQLHRSPR